MGGWVDGWMDGWMNGWMDGWMDAFALVDAKIQTLHLSIF